MCPYFGVASLIQILASLEGIEVAASLLQLYQRVSDSDRGALGIALTSHEDDLRALAQRPEAEPILCALIMSALGDPSEIVVQSVTRLNPEARASVIPQLACRGDVIEALPWEAWLREEPSPTSRLLARAAALVDYRVGDMFAPHIDSTEPLRRECEEFLDAIENGTRPSSDGEAGLQVVRLLEAAQHSLDRQGERVVL